MEEKSRIIPSGQDVRVLLADDSFADRKIIRDLLLGEAGIHIIAEAGSGVEALDLALKLGPDVILMDMEMPGMDGLNALHHLMVYRPTPTIMLSSLAQQGDPRCFDALRHGAVAFLAKSSLQGEAAAGGAAARLAQQLVPTIRAAARMTMMRTREPLFISPAAIPATVERASDIIFCEECGGRNIFEADQKRLMRELRCSSCGDLLEVNQINRYRRINVVSVLGAGNGGFANLLRIIPQLPEEMNGAIIAVLSAAADEVDSFTRYLNTVSRVNVQRVADSMHVEGGNCYIASSEDLIYMKPYSAQYTLKRASQLPDHHGPVDLLMRSVATLFRERAAGIVLSGDGMDGVRGILGIRQHNGLAAVLQGRGCLNRVMVDNVRHHCSVNDVVEERECAAFLYRFHQAGGGDSALGAQL